MKKYVCILFIMLLGLFAAFEFKGAQAAKIDAASAKSAIVMEKTTGRVLFEKNAYQKLPMASTTKIVTAITVINNCNIDEQVTIPKAACGIEGSSIYLQEGEILTVKQLLYGLMLRSGNDCAIALALHAGGSVQNFCKMMNDYARSVNAVNSNFTNPHGLHDDNHYTTAYDLALMSSCAMRNNVFREIVCTKRIQIPCTKRGYDRVLYNKNKMLSSYEGATGIKTGFTRHAGRCLVSSAQRDGMELICVVLNCGPMWEVSKQCMDSIFSEYRMEKYLLPYTYWGSVKVKNRQKGVGYYTKSFFSYPVNQADRQKITVRINVPEMISPPFEKDTEIGKVKYYYDNKLIFCANIYTIDGMDNISYFQSLKKIIEEMKYAH